MFLIKYITTCIAPYINTLGGYANFYGGMRRFNLGFLWVFLDVGDGVCLGKVNLVDTVLVNENAVKVKLDCET